MRKLPTSQVGGKQTAKQLDAFANRAVAELLDGPIVDQATAVRVEEIATRTT